MKSYILCVRFLVSCSTCSFNFKVSIPVITAVMLPEYAFTNTASFVVSSSKGFILYRSDHLITLMRAVLPRCAAIDFKFPAADRANLGTDGSPVHQVQVEVPPLVPAFIAAEYPFLAFCDLADLCPAVPTGRYFSAKLRNLPLRHRHSAEAVPPTVGLHRVRTDTELSCDSAVAASVRPKHCHLLFLLIIHSWYLRSLYSSDCIHAIRFLSTVKKYLSGVAIPLGVIRYRTVIHHSGQPESQAERGLLRTTDP